MVTDLVSEAEARLGDWEKKAQAWYTTYYAVGVAATILVVTTAARPSIFGDAAVQVIAWLAAVLQGVNTFLISLQKAAAYRSAWRRLKFALIDYESQSTPDPVLVKNAIKAGWETIDKGYTATREAGERRPKKPR